VVYFKAVLSQKHRAVGYVRVPGPDPNPGYPECGGMLVVTPPVSVRCNLVMA
jgi:hypothetical protein